MTTIVGAGFLHQRSKPVPVSAGWGNQWSSFLCRAGLVAEDDPGITGNPLSGVRRAIAAWSVDTPRGKIVMTT
jgi:hypothetical protein